jgi:hypothetical protein
MVDESVIDRGGTVAAPRLPIKDAAVGAEATVEVVENVVDLTAPGGAAHVQKVTPLMALQFCRYAVRGP